MRAEKEKAEKEIGTMLAEAEKIRSEAEDFTDHQTAVIATKRAGYHRRKWIGLEESEEISSLRNGNFLVMLNNNLNSSELRN